MRQNLQAHHFFIISQKRMWRKNGMIKYVMYWIKKNMSGELKHEQEYNRLVYTGIVVDYKWCGIGTGR